MLLSQIVWWGHQPRNQNHIGRKFNAVVGVPSSPAVVACFPPTTLAAAPWAEIYKLQKIISMSQKRSLKQFNDLFWFLIYVSKIMPFRLPKLLIL